MCVFSVFSVCVCVCVCVYDVRRKRERERVERLFECVRALERHEE